MNGTDGSPEAELSGRVLTAMEVGETSPAERELGAYVRFRRTDIETWLLGQRRGPEVESGKRR
jgi:hypothetical protein